MQRFSNRSDEDRIAFIGNYLPRQCGIATFTTDLCEPIATEMRRRRLASRTRQRHRKRLCLSRRECASS